MIDTATKRLTIGNLSSPWRMVGPVPDGTISSADRIAYIYHYAFAPAEAATAEFIYLTDASILAPCATATIFAPYATATIKSP